MLNGEEKFTRGTDLKRRTKKFALDVIKFCDTLPKSQELRVISGQLIRSSSSVGANYRSACRGRSRADFIAKMSLVEEEADETVYWLELIEELSDTGGELRRLKAEANELVAIVVASKKTARRQVVEQ